ncbi:MAG: Uma2 family endonuclease [Geitlerinemataceae cyanobacterium]
MSPSVDRLISQLPTLRWQIADYHTAIASGLLDDRPVELLAHRLIEMSPEGPEHAQISTDAADYLRQQLRDRAIVRDAKPITLPAVGSEPQPDLAIAYPDRATYRQRHPQPDEIFWVVEYAKTTLARDLDIKRLLYAEAGIPEYWVANLEGRELIRFWQPEAGDYRQRQTLTAGTVSPVCFPELALSVATMLRGW